MLALAPANAASNEGSHEADLWIDRCLSAPPEASAKVQQTVQAVCIRAFDLAIGEARNAERHSDLRRGQYWAQASQANALSLLIMLKRAESFNEYICGHDIRGIQAWNQIKPGSALLETMQRPRALDVAQVQCMQFWRG